MQNVVLHYKIIYNNYIVSPLEHLNVMGLSEKEKNLNVFVESEHVASGASVFLF